MKSYNIHDTIFAPITSLGSGSICVFRISGKEVDKFLDYLKIKDKISHSMIKLVKIIKNDVILDSAMIAYFKQPSSFTGEDCIEVSLHGSDYIISEFEDLLLHLEFRFAERGEFMYRAVMNNKISLTEAESIKALIDSKTEKQHNFAIRGMDGKIERIYKNWHEVLFNILSLIETEIDFSDQNLDLNHLQKKLRDQIGFILEEMKKYLSQSRYSDKISDGINIVVYGAPNVGKSSLLNAIAKKDIAITSSIAGTTRDIISFSTELNGFLVHFFDTAGIRENADNIIEQEGIRRAINKIKSADIKIFVLDPLCKDEKYIQNIVAENDIIVMNKIDLNPEVDLRNMIGIIAKDGIGLDILMQKITEIIKNKYEFFNDSMFVSRRQKTLVQESFEILNAIDLKNEIEIIAEEIRSVLLRLNKIFNPYSQEDILTNIFQNFCIGK